MRNNGLIHEFSAWICIRFRCKNIWHVFTQNLVLLMLRLIVRLLFVDTVHIAWILGGFGLNDGLGVAGGWGSFMVFNMQTSFFTLNLAFLRLVSWPSWTDVGLWLCFSHFRLRSNFWCFFGLNFPNQQTFRLLWLCMNPRAREFWTIRKPCFLMFAVTYVELNRIADKPGCGFH